MALIPARYRVAILALVASVAAHALVVVGVPGSLRDGRGDAAPTYTATLDLAPAAPAVPAAPKPPAPAAKRVIRHARHAKRVKVAEPVALPPPSSVEPAPVEPPHEAVAMAAPVAEPAAPPPLPGPPPPGMYPPAETMDIPKPVAAADPDPFPLEGLPERLSIDYKLTAAAQFLDAHAVYRWRRDGDAYTITGEGQADGLTRLFLNGEIVQRSTGTVTSAGLRPDRFIEKKPGSDDEGLEFDWPAHQVVFEVGPKRKTSALTDDTVDWLTMIFQLAHVPPQPKGGTMALKVFTQRKLYNFDLKVLGVEEIDIPIGKVRALHLQHTDPDDHQVVDVWLGVDQHYLPVKMRYPIAKNRLVVEQTATALSER